MAKTNSDAAPLSEPDKVDDYVRALTHPLKAEVEALRHIILSADKFIGEHIKWNHPAFFYTGEMKPFKPNEHKRHIIVFNLHSKEGGVLLVFPSGAKINDTSGLLTGDYADGRRLARFYNMDQVKAGNKALVKVIRAWLSSTKAVTASAALSGSAPE